MFARRAFFTQKTTSSRYTRASPSSRLPVYCSFTDSVGKTCKGPPLNEDMGVPHLTACYDACAGDPGCNLFSFHPDDGGRCKHFADCSQGYIDTDPTVLVYMLNGA